MWSVSQSDFPELSETLIPIVVTHEDGWWMDGLFLAGCVPPLPLTLLLHSALPTNLRALLPAYGLCTVQYSTVPLLCL